VVLAAGAVGGFEVGVAGLAGLEHLDPGAGGAGADGPDGAAVGVGAAGDDPGRGVLGDVRGAMLERELAAPMRVVPFAQEVTVTAAGIGAVL
jgi:hypothetical protein